MSARGKPPWDVPCPRCHAAVAVSCYEAGPDLRSRYIPTVHPERLVTSQMAAATRTGHDGWKIAVAVAAVILMILTVVAWASPTAQIPVISKVVCDVKGGTWSDGSALLGISPGCYASTP